MSELKQAIQSSYQKGVAARNAANAESKAAVAKKMWDIQQRSLAVLSALPAAFEQAGMKGEKTIQVCSTFYRHDKYYVPEVIQQGVGELGNNYEALNVELHTANPERAKKVHLSEYGMSIWQQLREAGLQPYIKFNWDGCGDHDWYEMWVNVPGGV